MEGSEDDTITRDSRSRQDKLPRSNKSPGPQERGTVESEERGKGNDIGNDIVMNSLQFLKISAHI